MASDCDTLEAQLPQAVWTGDGLLPDSLSPGTQHKIAGRGSDLSAHEPVTLDVDAVSFTDVTTGRSDYTYFSRADTTKSCPRHFSRVGAATLGWISGTDAVKTSSNINEIGAVEIAPPPVSQSMKIFSVRGV